MNADATTLLIQRIESQLPQVDVNVQDSNASFLSQVDNVVATAANYAQILGTAAGPIAQTAAVNIVKQIAADQTAGQLAAGASAEAAAAAGNAAGEAASAGVAAATAGEAAAIVLIISFAIALIAASDQSGSSQTQQLQELNTEVLGIGNETLATYWQGKLMGIISAWDSPTGGLGTDLDNLANEGTGGTDVKNDVTHFHDHALAFVNNVIPSKTPGAEVYWERPIVPNQAFTAQQVPYPAAVDEGTPVDAPIINGSIMGWYGTLPQPEPGPPLGGSPSQMGKDPRSVLPVLLLGLESYLTIEELVNVIDDSQPKFSDFLAQFSGDLQVYTAFLQAQYKLAVNGIVKTDIPSTSDILSFLYFAAEVMRVSTFPGDTQWWGGSYPYQAIPGSWPYAGYTWNGVYGVVNAYPPYGAYESSPPISVPSSSPSYIIDVMNTDSLLPDINGPFNNAPYLRETILETWTAPWVKVRLQLGIMARWKAIYLINGYDKVWSILQNLRALTNQPPLPALTLTQDGTIADGNWSARELITMLSAEPDVLGTPEGPIRPSLEGPAGYSLFSLLQGLDWIANGNWVESGSGYPLEALVPASGGLTGPASFRGLLAAVAV